MRAMKPLGSQYRLQALIKLGEAYEKAGDPASAADVYDDLAKSGPKDTARAAAARAAVLRKSAGGAKGKHAAAEPDVDGAVAPDNGGTQVMPSDAGDDGTAVSDSTAAATAPAPAKKAKKKKKKSTAKGRRAAPAADGSSPASGDSGAAPAAAPAAGDSGATAKPEPSMPGMSN
jgi:hypothetical protein